MSVVVVLRSEKRSEHSLHFILEYDISLILQRLIAIRCEKYSVIFRYRTHIRTHTVFLHFKWLSMKIGTLFATPCFSPPPPSTEFVNAKRAKIMVCMMMTSMIAILWLFLEWSERKKRTWLWVDCIMRCAWPNLSKYCMVMTSFCAQFSSGTRTLPLILSKPKTTLWHTTSSAKKSQFSVHFQCVDNIAIYLQKVADCDFPRVPMYIWSVSRTILKLFWDLSWAIETTSNQLNSTWWQQRNFVPLTLNKLEELKRLCRNENSKAICLSRIWFRKLKRTSIIQMCDWVLRVVVCGWALFPFKFVGK